MLLKAKPLQTLDKLLVNQSAEIKSVGNGPNRDKLFDMGLYPGQVIQMINKAPFGDPVAVKLNSGMLMLRVAEASNIQVEELSE